MKNLLEKGFKYTTENSTGNEVLLDGVVREGK